MMTCLYGAGVFNAHSENLNETVYRQVEVLTQSRRAYVSMRASEHATKHKLTSAIASYFVSCIPCKASLTYRDY